MNGNRHQWSPMSSEAVQWRTKTKHSQCSQCTRRSQYSQISLNCDIAPNKCGRHLPQWVHNANTVVILPMLETASSHAIQVSIPVISPVLNFISPFMDPYRGINNASRQLLCRPELHYMSIPRLQFSRQLIIDHHHHMSESLSL